MANNSDNDSYAPVPNLVYGYENGASSSRQNALKYQLENDAKQNALINDNASSSNQGGGRHFSGKNRKLGKGKGKRNRAGKRTEKKSGKRMEKRMKMGGQVAPAAGSELEVPSFPSAGPSISPINATSSSVATNQIALNAKVAACNDCYATGTCDQTMGCPQQGGKHKSPYSISQRRVKLSPFKTVNSVKKTLKAHKSGRKIGFTQRSSLRSMGLIPRSDGLYKLGQKYANL